MPTTEPDRVTAGDVLRWTRPDLAALAVSGVTLRYVFVIPGAAALTVTATGADFAMEVPAAVTAIWPAGSVRWTAFFVDGADRREMARGVVRVDFNPESVTASSDIRSHAQRVLAAIEAVIARRATQDDLKITLSDGRSLERVSFAEALRLRDHYRREVAAEQKAEGLMPGKRGNLLVRF